MNTRRRLRQTPKGDSRRIALSIIQKDGRATPRRQVGKDALGWVSGRRTQDAQMRKGEGLRSPLTSRCIPRRQLFLESFLTALDCRDASSNLRLVGPCHPALERGNKVSLHVAGFAEKHQPVSHCKINGGERR
jgi:hypothetical protein